jgi:hypothetical protein
LPNMRATVFLFKQRRTRHYDNRKWNTIYFYYQIQQVRELNVFTCETRETEHLLTFKQKVVYRFQLNDSFLFLFNSAKECVFIHTAEMPKPHSLRSRFPHHPIGIFPFKTLVTITTLQKTYDILF